MTHQPMRARPGDGKIEPCLSLSDPACVGLLYLDDARQRQLMDAAGLPWEQRAEYAVVVSQCPPSHELLWTLFPLAAEHEQVQ